MVIRSALEAFANFTGAPFEIQEEIERWEQVFEGKEEAVRAWLRPRFKDKRWIPLDQVAAALGVDLGAEVPGIAPIGPIASQWSEASTRFPCGLLESRVRAQQSAQVSSRGGPSEDQARDWLHALSTARVADGHPPHRLVGPARYEVEQAHREAWQLARSRGRDALSREEERAFAAYFRDADRKDAAAGWEVPASPSAQSEEEGDAGLPPAARRFVGR